MGKGILIRKVEMNCPLCGKLHEVEEREQTATTVIKGEKVKYKERFFFCTNGEKDENEFETGSMTNHNLLNARNAYRINHGLLTSDDIISIRKNYGLSQVDLAKLFGWGEATVSRYESSAIQDESYDVMLRLIKDNPFEALKLLKRNKGKFPKAKVENIKSKIIDSMDSYGKEYLSRQEFEGEYVNYEEPSDFNGFTTLNIEIIEVMVSYLAKRVDNLYKVKLMKFLWYADVLSYKNSGKSITGMVYTHGDMGALPIGHYKLMNLENINVQEEESYNCELMLHILPAENVNCDLLSDKYKFILDKIINKFKNYDTEAIVNYMHKEKAYSETRFGEVIPFSLAKEIKDF